MSDNFVKIAAPVLFILAIGVKFYSKANPPGNSLFTAVVFTLIGLGILGSILSYYNTNSASNQKILKLVNVIMIILGITTIYLYIKG